MQQIKKIGTEEVLHEYGESTKKCAEHAVANEVKLNGAELNGAELNGAELNGAELNDAELNYAKLNYAKLNGAELNYAKIGTTSFKHADMRNCDRDDDAKIARMDVCEWPVTIQFDGIHIGCKTFTLDQIMGMTEEIAATHSSKAPIRWRRWGKVLQELAKATLG